MVTRGGATEGGKRGPKPRPLTDQHGFIDVSWAGVLGWRYVCACGRSHAQEEWDQLKRDGKIPGLGAAQEEVGDVTPAPYPLPKLQTPDIEGLQATAREAEDLEEDLPDEVGG